MGRHAAACLCRTWPGPAGSYVKWMPALLLQQWPGPNDDQPYRRIIYFVIFHAIQRRKLHAFIHKKASTSGDEVPPLAPDPLPGLIPYAPLEDFPDPVTSRQAGIQSGVTVVEPQKSTQKFLGLP